jgi:SAM-dependent methyltransferase
MTKDGYAMSRCRSCGYASVEERPSIAELVAMYERVGGVGVEPGDYTLDQALDEERRYPNSTLDAERIVRRCAELTPPGRFLDVGCGQGFFSLAARRAGFDIDPIEFAPPERRVATQLLEVAPDPVTFEDLDRPPCSYRAILMSQVLEHAHDPVAWVEKAARLLAPGGVLAVAVPNFNSIFRRVLQSRDPYVIPPFHLNYFTSTSLRLLMQRFGITFLGGETVSKLPPRAYARLGPLAALGRAAVPAVLRVVDRVGCGIFLNAYGRAPQPA